MGGPNKFLKCEQHIHASVTSFCPVGSGYWKYEKRKSLGKTLQIACPTCLDKVVPFFMRLRRFRSCSRTPSVVSGLDVLACGYDIYERCDRRSATWALSL